MPTLQERNKRIEELSQGRGFAFLTQQQKTSLDQPSPPKEVDPEVARERTILGAPRATIESDQQKLVSIQTGLEDVRVQGEGVQKSIQDRQRKEAEDTAKREAEATETAQFTPEEKAELGITDIEKTQEQKDLEVSVESLNKQTQSALDELDIARTNVSSANKALIDSIKQKFAVRRTQQEDINKRTLALQTTAGLRRGTAQFAPEIQSSILSAEERAGISKLSELDALESSIVAEAELAVQQEDFEALNDKLNRIDDLREEKQEALNKLKEVQEEEQIVREQTLKKTITQGRVLQSVGEGITDPVELFNQLNFDAQGNFTGDVSFDDIIGITSQLPTPEKTGTGAGFTLGSADLRFDAEGNIIARGSKVGGVNAGVPSGGDPALNESVNSIPNKVTTADLNNMTADEQEFVTRVIRLLPTKLKDSEKERTAREVEALRDFRGGKPLQSVVDEMKGFVITNEELQPLANTFRALATGTDLELGEIAASINLNDPVKAMTVVENANLEKSAGELSDVAGSQKLVKDANRVLELLEDAPSENLGAFDGTVFKVKKFGGLTDEETLKTQRLETALVNLLNEIRRKSLGTAVTEAEIAFLEPLLSSIKDQPEIIATKMDELKQGTVREHNTARNVTALPQVTEEQLLDNEVRLGLYKEVQSEADRRDFEQMTNEEFLSIPTSSSPGTAKDNEEFFKEFK